MASFVDRVVLHVAGGDGGRFTVKSSSPWLVLMVATAVTAVQLFCG